MLPYSESEPWLSLATALFVETSRNKAHLVSKFAKNMHGGRVVQQLGALLRDSLS